MEKSVKFTVQDMEANYITRKTQREPWYTGADLLKKLDATSERKYNKRYVFNDLMNFLNTKDSDICALYGLRRTGKSVLMRQAMSALIEQNEVKAEEIAYITFSQNTSSTDAEIIQDIRDRKNIVRYFFIDEISYIKMKLEDNALNLLADEFATQGIKIVIAGTFSFALKLLSNETLFDRMRRIDTTYFSFKEAYEIFGYSLEHFIQYGGIIIEPQNKKMTPEEYMKTAVTNNIVKSLMKSDKIYEIGYLDKRIDDIISNGGALKYRLETLVKRVIDSYMKVLLYSNIVRSNYKYFDVGNLSQLIRQRSERDYLSDDLLDIINIDKKKYYKILEEKLGTLNTDDMTEECFKEFISILKQIGVIEDIYLQHAKESCFITNYLRYGLCEEILNQIEDAIKIETSGRYGVNLASDNLKGPIMETIIYLDLQHSNRYNFDKYRNEASGYEVDLVIKNNDKKTMDIYEIKHSSQALITHAKNLVNTDFILELEAELGYKVSSYNIIYNGESIVKVVDPKDVFEEMSTLAIKEAGKDKWNQLKQRANTFNWEDKIVKYINATQFLCEI